MQRIYVDMVADLFHYGHVNLLKRLKNDNTYIIVGINSDEDVTTYKRKPIMTTEERTKVVESCKYVDEVIPDAPLCITNEIIDNYKIDLVVHAHKKEDDSIYRKFYKIPIERGIFKRMDYTESISTTDIINRIIKRYK
jgi:cytidyltransferase-like protein